MHFPTHYSAPSAGLSGSHLGLAMWFASIFMGTSFMGWAAVAGPAIVFLIAGYKKVTKKARENSEEGSDEGDGGNSGQSEAGGHLSSQDAANAFGASRTGKAVDDEMERRAALRRRKEERDTEELDRIADEDAELLSASMPGGEHSHISGNEKDPAAVRPEVGVDSTGGDIGPRADAEGAIADSVLATDMV
ncbi:MAG: hypothetical protein RB191_16080 [Terriglobia bacterium]|nr:hypothetical protein [Terriglobia bacterium]